MNEKDIIEAIKKEKPHLNFYVVAEDIRYPTVVFDDNAEPEYDNYAGYMWDWDNMCLGRRVCTCAAWNASECCCGAWYD